PPAGFAPCGRFLFIGGGKGWYIPEAGMRTEKGGLMRRGFLKYAAVFFLVLGLCGAVLSAPRAAVPYAHGLDVRGATSPATLELIGRHSSGAARDGAAVLVLRWHTPGGLYDSTQALSQAILDAPVPVVTYVAPAGAHAASAGTYILYASHVAAMAPA